MLFSAILTFRVEEGPPERGRTLWLTARYRAGLAPVATVFIGEQLHRSDEQIDDKALLDLWGVVKVSEVTVHGVSLLNFDGFAPAGRWEELSVFTDNDQRGSEVSS